MGFVGEPLIEKRLVRAMCDSIRHRGPDEEGYLYGGNVALGMRRLAIIDLESGQQPIFNEDRSVAVVYNGEAYNFPELRKMLGQRGHTFSSNTDTECVVHLYEEFGDECVKHLRGMFAFAVWDEKKRRLLLARDRVGKKPLYYRITDEGIWFASEPKSLVQDPRFERRVDRTALHHYLTYQYVPHPWCIYEGVKKLPPAHTLSFQEGRCELKRYWYLSFHSKDKLSISEDEASEGLREELSEAVKIRLLSDRPIGAFLSGGIDSSIVVALMAQHSLAPVKTFSIGFDEGQYDEREFARKVANRYGCEHHEYVVHPSAADVLTKLTWHYDEPYADSSAIPTYYLSEMTAGHVTVALNGDGGDECFAGYPRYRGTLLLNGRGRVLRPFVGMAPTAARLGSFRRRGTPAAYLERFLRALGEKKQDRYAATISCFQNAEKFDLYSDTMRDHCRELDSWKLLSDLFEASEAESLIDQMLDVDTQSYLPGDLLAKVDIATMANSLEARSPFLDHRVMEYAASLPAEMKIHGQSQKYILKKMGSCLLPLEVINRRKMGFGVPIARWLRTELREMTHDLLLDDTARGRGYFETSFVDQLVRKHESGIDCGARIWALLQFELWHRMFIDSRAISQPIASVK